MFRAGKPKEPAPSNNPVAPQPQPPPATPPAYGSAPPQPQASMNAEPQQQQTRTPESISNSGTRNMSNESNSVRAYSESDAIARDIKEGTLSGFVGNGTVLTGEANFKGMLRVDGHLTGRVSSQDGTLIVSSGGQVDANIEVSVAQIYGTVNGDIIATKRIEMGRVAKVNGDIQTPALVIEQGAMFEGSCRMMHMQEAEERKKQQQATAPPPAQQKSEPPKPAAPTTNAPATSTNAPGAGVPKPAGDGAARPSPVGS